MHWFEFNSNFCGYFQSFAKTLNERSSSAVFFSLVSFFVRFVLFFFWFRFFSLCLGRHVSVRISHNRKIIFVWLFLFNLYTLLWMCGRLVYCDNRLALQLTQLDRFFRIILYIYVLRLMHESRSYINKFLGIFFQIFSTVFSALKCFEFFRLIKTAVQDFST